MDDTTTGSALTVAEREATRLRRHIDSLTRRIDGALFLIEQADPCADAGRTAVLLASLRITLGASKVVSDAAW